MTTATRTTKTAAPKTAPAAEKSADKPAETSGPFDLSALSAAKVERPAPSAGAGRRAADNSTAEKWIRESWAERDERGGSGRAVTVPTAVVGSVKSQLNRAAKTNEVGVSISEKKNADGTTTVSFYATKRKKYAPRAKSETVNINPENTEK